MESLFKAFLALMLFECIAFNWFIMSIWFELKDIRKILDKKNKEK